MADQSLRARVDDVLAGFLATETAQLTRLDPALAPVARQLAATVADGKRLRAMFCYWGWRAAGQPDCEEIVRAAAAMELVHAAAIVHDDIIDNSATRRHAPAAHVALRSAIAERRSRDDGGQALAIVAGGLLVSWAGQLFFGCGLPDSFLGRARPLWFTMARELAAGECLEIMAAGGPASASRARQIIRYKTAKYTVEHPLHIGAAAAGGTDTLRAACTDYGIPLGEAFQLRDDLLGVFGDPALTGKSNTDDLRGRKPTVLLAIALASAGAGDRRELSRLLDRGDALDGADLRTIREIISRTGARDRVESMIAQRAARAVSAIERTAIPGPAAEALTALVPALTARARLPGGRAAQGQGRQHCQDGPDGPGERRQAEVDQGPAGGPDLRIRQPAVGQRVQHHVVDRRIDRRADMLVQVQRALRLQQQVGDLPRLASQGL
jgi:geranylgeranyl diphosphate synthase, type I